MKPKLHRLRWAIVLLTAGLVLAAGITYTTVRQPAWKSEADLVLHLGKVKPERISPLLDGFLRSGSAGTFVEHVTAKSTLRAAGAPPVTVAARSVPDTRVIEISASGPQVVVQPALSAVIRAAQLSQNQLKDPFRLGVLDPPSPPVEAGPSTGLLLAATGLLAVLAGLFVFVLTRRSGAADTGALPAGGAAVRHRTRPPASRRPVDRP